MKSAIVACAAALFAASCASAPDFPSQRERLARQIADDAVGFNEAYGQAVSAQILLNILRSRDRMPRFYLAMTGISDSPSWTTTQSAAIGGIPLGGQIGTPWGVGGLGVERERARRPSYAVQPFDAATLARTAFEPTPSSVFQHYCYSGWPRDLLLLMMVESIEKVDASGHIHVYTNEANTIFDDCVASVQTKAARSCVRCAPSLRSPSSIRLSAAWICKAAARCVVLSKLTTPHRRCAPPPRARAKSASRSSPSARIQSACVGLQNC